MSLHGNTSVVEIIGMRGFLQGGCNCYGASVEFTELMVEPKASRNHRSSPRTAMEGISIFLPFVNTAQGSSQYLLLLTEVYLLLP